jgi:cell division protein FtsQ
VVGLVAVVWALWFSPLLRVDQVEVQGISVLTPEQVRAAAGILPGRPMISVDVDAAAERVAELAPVASVSVGRSWPGTVVLTVVERTPALGLTGSGSVQLLDASGVAYRTVGSVPTGLPVLTTVDPTPQAVAEVLKMVDDLPEALRARLIGIRAETPDSIELDLTEGVVVVWGSGDDSPRKAQVLQTLMAQPGRVYVVSAPEVPAIRP